MIRFVRPGLAFLLVLATGGCAESQDADSGQGGNSPGDTVAGDTGNPGDTAGGDTSNPGDTSGGDTTPGDTAPGDSAGGDAAPGDTVPGDSAGGDTTPGDTAPGDTGGGEPDQCDPTITGTIGSPCASGADCSNTPGVPYCQTSFPNGGYCLNGQGDFADNCDRANPATSCGHACLACAVYPYYPVARCYVACAQDTDCRTGYTCQFDQTGNSKVCFPTF